MPPQIAAARPSAATSGGQPSFKAAGSGLRAGGQAAFKPPRPQLPEKQPKKQQPKKQQGKRPQESINVDEEVVDVDDDAADAADASRHRGKRREGRAADGVTMSDDMGGDEVDDDADDGEPSIPPELLTRLLHHHFSKANSRLTQDANASVGKYFEIFVREAVARSVAERREGGFLDVCFPPFFFSALFPSFLPRSRPH